MPTKSSRPLPFVLSLAAATVFLPASFLPAQAASANAAPKPPEFDVVSIRPNNSGHNGGAWGVNNNRYQAKNTPLVYIILQAYLGQLSASSDRLKGAPSWVTTDGYDITAKAGPATADSWKGLRQAEQVAIAAPLLRTMLGDRCKLVVHTVPTELQGYALVVGKHPLKIKEWQPNEPLPKNYGTVGGGWMIVYSEPGDPNPHTSFLKITIAQLIEFISMGGPPILDQTGLTGTYDIELPRIETVAPPPAEPSAPLEPGTPTVPGAPRDAAHFFDWNAVGLEMKPIKVPGIDLVIDHIERPSEN